MQGKRTILGIVLITGLLAGFAWWWRWTQSDDASRFWGLAHTSAILAPDQGIGFWLEPADASAAGDDILRDGSRTYRMAKITEITSARGLLHARHALTQDASFNWHRYELADIDPTNITFDAGIRLMKADRPTTILFSFQSGYLELVEGPKLIPLAEHATRGWQSYLQRTLPSREAKLD